MKNLKRFFSYLSIGCMALCAITFCACGGDDEDNESGGGGSTSNVDNPLVSEGGKLLTSVSFYYDSNSPYEIYTFSYDGKLRPYKVSDMYEDLYVIDYDKGIVETWEGECMGVGLSMKFNSDGYITKVKGSWEFEDEGEMFSGSVDWNASYSSEGRMNSVNTVSEIREGNYHEKYTSNNSLTWSNGNLTNSTVNGKWTDSKGKETGSVYRSYSLEYGSMINKFKQYPFVLDDPMTLCGLFGKGPNMLPISVTYAYKEVDAHEEYENNAFMTSEYTLNDDGSIGTETWKKDSRQAFKCVYSYSSANSASRLNTRSCEETKESSKTDKAKRVREFLMSLPFVLERKAGK